MTYMLLLNCALKLVEEIILYYDARSKKHKKIKEFVGPQSNTFVVILCTKRIKQNIGASGLHACFIPVS